MASNDHRMETQRYLVTNNPENYNSVSRSRNARDYLIDNMDDPEFGFHGTVCFLCNSQHPDFIAISTLIKTEKEKRLKNNLALEAEKGECFLCTNKISIFD
jgi:hypothetical protein